MAAIYDKALKRKDLSGIVKEKEQVALPDQKKKKGGEQKDENDPKSGADVGKIVNLMAGDANRVSGRTCIPRLFLISRPVPLPDLSADLRHVLYLRRAARTLDWVHLPVPVRDYLYLFFGFTLPRPPPDFSASALSQALLSSSLDGRSIVSS